MFGAMKLLKIYCVYIDKMKRTCVHIRRFIRRPEIRWGTSYVRRNFVKSTVLSFVPSAIDDLAIHHANLSVNEIIHVGIDTATINAIGIILSFASKL
jgi:hypothetical protein